MPNIAFFLKHLKESLIRKHVGYPELAKINNIVLFGPDSHSVDASGHSLYLGEARYAQPVLEALPKDMRTTFFLSGDSPCLNPYFKKTAINLIVTELPIIELYGIVNRILYSYTEWDRTLTSALCEEKGLSHIIELAGKILQGHILLLNPGMHVIEMTSQNYFMDPYAKEVQDTGCLSYDSTQKLLSGFRYSPVYENEVRHLCPVESDHQYYLQNIKYQGTDIATLMFITDDYACHMDIPDMINHMSGLLRPLLSQQSTDLTISGNHLASLLNDFSSVSNLSTIEVRDRIRMMPFPVKTYIRCIIISFQETQPNSSYELLLSQLSILLPNTNMTIWKKKIVILHSSDLQEYKLPKDMDLDKWNTLLDQFHATAVVSNATKVFASFRSLYYLTRRLNKVLRTMSIANPYKNVIFYEDYSIYLVIDMAAEQFQRVLGNSDIILLAAPAVVTLTRYDKQHNTNLRDVLYFYLKSGRSVSKTAEMMYMHRNTVLNKLKKIQELFPVDLDDGKTMEILLFSCQLTRYYEEHLNLSLRI